MIFTAARTSSGVQADHFTFFFNAEPVFLRVVIQRISYATEFLHVKVIERMHGTDTD